MLIQLNERAGLQGRPDDAQMGFQHLPGGFQSEVHRAHQHQFPRSALQQMGVVEVGVLGHHYPPLIHRYHIQDAVARCIPIRQVQLMDRIVTGIVKNSAQAGWQVRVDEELYATAGCWPAAKPPHSQPPPTQPWHHTPPTASSSSPAPGKRGEAICLFRPFPSSFAWRFELGGTVAGMALCCYSAGASSTPGC